MEEAHQRAAASELRDTQSVVSDRIDDNGQNWVTGEVSMSPIKPNRTQGKRR